MRKLIIAAAPLALLASPAMAATAAPSVNGNVAITGEVTARCAFTLGSETIALGDISGTDGKLDATKVNGKSKNLTGWCNGTNSTVAVKATALTNTLTGTGFDSTVTYTAKATVGTVEATDSDSLDTAAGVAAKVGLFSGNIAVSLSNAQTPGNGLMVAGDYSGNVQVTLAPAV